MYRTETGADQADLLDLGRVLLCSELLSAPAVTAVCEPCWDSCEVWAGPGEAEWRNVNQGSGRQGTFRGPET